MDMVGEVRLEASRSVVWDALNDPEILKKSIPGCEELQKLSDTSYTAVVVSKVGPIKARFLGNVTLSEINAPSSSILIGEGQGGMAGFAKAEIRVELEELDQSLTLLRYTVKANVGGKLAQLGSRLIDATARKNADDFFDGFGKAVGGIDSKPSASIDFSQYQQESFGASQVQTVKKTNTSNGSGEAKLGYGIGDTAFMFGSNDPDVMDVWVDDKIKIWISDHIAVVTFNRPKTKNAMTLGMWKAIPGILGALERDPNVRSVILTGAGEDFSAGADISEFGKVRATDKQVWDYEVAVDACCDVIANINKPTIAVIRGFCLGGGAHLAMSCDFRYASSSAKFGIPAARLSIIYGVKGTQKLLNLVGLVQAKKILFGSQRFAAPEALKLGFIDHMSGSIAPVAKPSFFEKLLGKKNQSEQKLSDDPMIAARSFAKLLASNAPLSISGAKYILNGVAMGRGALDSDLAEELIAAAGKSNDYHEGRKAFTEKREPQFQGN
jgi:enoyl-CoA hydratase/carnithine racemase/carbon monoxide dehydrogenase subunit G